MKNSSFSIRWQGILYTRQRPKLRLKSFFGESIHTCIVFHQQTDRNQPELVYSSELSLQTVINTAFKQSASEPPEPKASSREERTTKDIVDMTDRKRVLYQAEMKVKADINETSRIAIQPLQTADLSLEASKASVSESLYWLLRLSVSSEDTESVFETPGAQAHQMRGASL